ncbi:MAG: heme exporter protein CcmD [Proteobacteria bacterium]|nr:heme exporter protein CcmD [Pseudomonadota bacterium]
MPDLTPYTFEVLCAYAIALVLLVGIIAQSLWQARVSQRKIATLRRVQKSKTTKKNPVKKSV